MESVRKHHERQESTWNARPVNHVQEDKVNDEHNILFDRITACNIDNVENKDASALIRKTAKINQQIGMVLVDGGSSVNLIRPGIATKKHWACVMSNWKHLMGVARMKMF